MEISVESLVFVHLKLESELEYWRKKTKWRANEMMYLVQGVMFNPSFAIYLCYSPSELQNWSRMELLQRK